MRDGTCNPPVPRVSPDLRPSLVCVACVLLEPLSLSPVHPACAFCLRTEGDWPPARSVPTWLAPHGFTLRCRPGTWFARLAPCVFRLCRPISLATCVALTFVPGLAPFEEIPGLPPMPRAWLAPCAAHLRIWTAPSPLPPSLRLTSVASLRLLPVCRLRTRVRPRLAFRSSRVFAPAELAPCVCNRPVRSPSALCTVWPDGLRVRFAAAMSCRAPGLRPSPPAPGSLGCPPA